MPNNYSVHFSWLHIVLPFFPPGESRMSHAWLGKKEEVMVSGVASPHFHSQAAAREKEMGNFRPSAPALMPKGKIKMLKVLFIWTNGYIVLEKE